MSERITIILVILFVWLSQARAQVDDDSPIAPGIAAKYSGANGKSCDRIDPQIAFAWGSKSPDVRIPPGKFSVHWQGFLFAQGEGMYTLHVHAAGKVSLKIKGKTLLKVDAKKPKWFFAKSVQLNFGHHPIEIDYQSAGEKSQISLYWSGPDFALEPVSSRWLWHDREKSKGSEFQKGRRLVRALRCAACHKIPESTPLLPAPALDVLAGYIRHGWLVRRLTETGKTKNAIDQRMPHFGVNKKDAEAIAAFLLSAAKKPQKKPRPGNANEGKKLFHTVGCLACHTVNGAGRNDLFGGGDLTTVADKRPGPFFGQWLKDPAKLNQHHRMPTFSLKEKERDDLAAYLATLSNRVGQNKKPNEAGVVALIRRGQLLVKSKRCVSCHAVPGNEKFDSNLLVRLPINLKWDDSCVGKVNVKKNRPGYRLAASHVKAIRTYIKTLQSIGHKVAFRSNPRLMLEEKNCFSCHARGRSMGMIDQIPAIAKAHPKLAQYLNAVSPPSLESVGDKFHEKILKQAIAGELPKRRPWMRIRMPKFPMTKDEAEVLADHFVRLDRIPEFQNSTAQLPDKKLLRIAGRRLVGAAGFNCVSCHQVGKTKPKSVEPNVHGPNLSMLGKHVRRPWFNRFVKDSVRIGLRTEMPSLKIPVSGILDGNLDHQLAGVWTVLNQKGFNPPRQQVVRVVRHHKVGGNQRAYVLTDVFRVGMHEFIKPLVIGLSNRHTVLFDLATGQLVAWVVGDIARQLTEGKSWFWELAGRSLLPVRIGSPEITLLLDGKRLLPQRRGQFITEFDSIEHIQDGIRFSHRLHFEMPKSGKRHVLLVRQSFTNLASGQYSGFRREMEISGLPMGASVEVRMATSKGQNDLHIHTGAKVGRKPSKPSIQMFKPSGVHLQEGKDGAFLVLKEKRFAGKVSCTVDFYNNVLTSTAEIPATPAINTKLVRLNLTSGFEATQLALPSEIMPTAMAWRKDGTLVLASLRGRVWQARDTDGDGLEDNAKVFSDELAAPYGLLVNGDAIEVINKYALLRLHDKDKDGRAERTETLASGWGHTSDYHDWAVGPVRDRNGNYYIALPCCQDERTKAAAHLRGQALKLVPRKPTRDNPLAYSIEKIAGGIRFPMGMVINRRGDLFTTDNQGNYNPFNELNHLIKGKHYGFLNRYEQKAGRKPPLTSPAINIPHPWTRSVNGICFLHTPDKIAKKIGKSLFGPFEGHLIGCEYDNRAVVRMTLQRVGDTYQGAAYPFCQFPKSEFQGPICCGIAPSGDIYIGNMHDSGWRAGPNIGSIVRLRQTGKLPPGIAEMRAAKNGFNVEFTTKIDALSAVKISNYTLSSYRRIPTPAYGGPDRDRRTEKIAAAKLHADGRTVSLVLNQLREGFVYELRVRGLTPNGKTMHPAEAHFTLRRIPNE